MPRPVIWKPRYPTRRMRERAWASADVQREQAARRKAPAPAVPVGAAPPSLRRRFTELHKGVRKWVRGRVASPPSRCSSRTWLRPRRSTRGLRPAGMYEDDNSAVFNFENTLINLLKTTAAPELIEPAAVASRDAGARVQFTIEVDDVDAMCAELTTRGVELLNGPMDRPWGSGPPASAIPAATSGRSRISARLQVTSGCGWRACACAHASAGARRAARATQ